MFLDHISVYLVLDDVSETSSKKCSEIIYWGTARQGGHIEKKFCGSIRMLEIEYVFLYSNIVLHY